MMFYVTRRRNDRKRFRNNPLNRFPFIASKHLRKTNIYLIIHVSQDKCIPPSGSLGLSSISSMLKSYPQYSLVNSETKIKSSQISIVFIDGGLI